MFRKATFSVGSLSYLCARSRVLADTRLDNAELKADYEAITADMEFYKLPVKVPTYKYLVSIHGSISSGKSSFINDILGFCVEATAPEETDTNVSIIYTVSNSDFQRAVSKHAKIKGSMEAISLAELQRDDVTIRGRDDKRVMYGVIKVLHGVEAKRAAGLQGLGELAKHVSDERLRVILINEDVYKLHGEKMFDCAKDSLASASFPSSLTWEDRVHLAKGLVLVDTPGIKTVDDQQMTELKCILGFVSRSYFLAGPVAESNRHALTAFTKAVKDAQGNKFKDTSLWNKITFLLTRIDETMNTKTAHRQLLMRGYEFGKVFSSQDDQDRVEPPVAGFVYAIGLPSKQKASPNKVYFDMFKVQDMLYKDLLQNDSLDIKRAESISEMAKELVRHMDSTYALTFYNTAAMVQLYERAYDRAKRLESKYEGKLKAFHKPPA